MFTNQKVLTGILIAFIVGTAIYFTVDKFNKDTNTSLSASPSPSPAALDFSLTASPQPQATEQPLAKNDERVLLRNKKLDKFPGVLAADVLQNKKAIIQTNKGIIEIEIYPETPITSSNFLILAANGFYDGLTFHRIEPGFVIQGGDPLGNGMGGPGYQFQDEPVTLDYKKGIVAMANSGPDTNGSQFFIMLEDNPELPKNYTIFGNVIAGMEVVSKIAVGDTMQKVVIQDLK